MSIEEGEVVLRQRFESANAVTNVLNNFLVNPKPGFNFYSRQNFRHDPFGATRYDDYGKVITDGNDQVRERIATIRKTSRDIGVRSVQLSQSIFVEQLSKSLRLGFTAQDEVGYFKIIEDFYDDPLQNPSIKEIAAIVRNDLYVDLPLKTIRQGQGFLIAKRTLRHTFEDPATLYEMKVNKAAGVSRHTIPPLSEIMDKDVV